MVKMKSENGCGKSRVYKKFHASLNDFLDFCTTKYDDLNGKTKFKYKFIESTESNRISGTKNVFQFLLW